MDDLTGHTLGPYRVLERIGAGGMAIVYRAYHAAMDRYVAIKVLPRHLARDPDFHARFLREARTIARLEHHHILTVHDVAEEDGVPFLVMRYTTNGDLSRLLTRRSVTIVQAVQLIRQVASALAYAHRQGVIHRDVKPANVLIGPDGDALLTDFGIAKIYADTLHLTGEGQIIGTPAYMAPEQMQAEAVDARADVYALGVVLYQALTGELPFVAETPLAVALMHLHSPLRPPRQVNPAIPDGLERIVLRAMAKLPADRFQTMDEMAQALQDGLVDLGTTLKLDTIVEPPTESLVSLPPIVPPPPTPAHPPTTVRRLAPLWLGAGAIIIIAALILAVVLVRPSRGPSTTPSAAPLAAAPLAVATGSSANLRFPAAAAKINAMTVTADAIWAATDGGLVRWNANGTGQVFTTDDGLPFDEPGAIVAAADGTLWVGGGGVAHIRPTANGISVVAAYTKDDGLGTGVIRTLLLDPDGSLWAGGPQGDTRFALSHFTGTSWKTDELPTDDPLLTEVPLQIQSLLRSRDGSLWLGMKDGRILRWDGKRWSRFGPTEGIGPGTQGGDTRIRRLVQSSDATIWAAASDLGLLRFDETQARWHRVEVVRDDVPIRTVTQVADGSLWAAGDGLIARSADGGQTWAEVGATASGIGTDISALVQDAAGRVWAGAYDGGVSVFDGTTWHPLQR